MKILLIRHAKTKGNLERRYIGRRSDEPVSESETESIRRLGCRLLERLPEDFLLVTSPMLRCRMTAEGLTGRCDSYICKDFEEIDFGNFEGKSFEELSDDPEYRSWLESGGRMSFPGGESREDFISRNAAAFRRMTAENQCEDFAVIVCHGGTVMSIMSCLTGGEYFDFSVPNLDGYFLETAENGGNINVLSYSRLSDWLSA